MVSDKGSARGPRGYRLMHSSQCFAEINQFKPNCHLLIFPIGCNNHFYPQCITKVSAIMREII